MVYACDNCHFLFQLTGKAEQCPDCGKHTVRPATEQEIAAFEKQLAESKEMPL